MWRLIKVCIVVCWSLLPMKEIFMFPTGWCRIFIWKREIRFTSKASSYPLLLLLVFNRNLCLFWTSTIQKLCKFCLSIYVWTGRMAVCVHVNRVRDLVFLMLFSLSKISVHGRVWKLFPQFLNWWLVFFLTSMEFALRKFACLSVGDVIPITYNDNQYDLKVLELKPNDAVQIIECDMSVRLLHWLMLPFLLLQMLILTARYSFYCR